VLLAKNSEILRKLACNGLCNANFRVFLHFFLFPGSSGHCNVATQVGGLVSRMVVTSLGMNTIKHVLDRQNSDMGCENEL
jgi:hypothetical protein